MYKFTEIRPSHNHFRLSVILHAIVQDRFRIVSPNNGRRIRTPTQGKQRVSILGNHSGTLQSLAVFISL
jgi:hypothetical protein